MEKFEMITDKWNTLRKDVTDGINTTGSTYTRVKSIIGVIIMVLYRLRKIVLAIPVVFYALKIASYNMQNLPEIVGINLQSNGAFAETISRTTAVMGPLGITGACLVLMLCSRKALYPWAVSVFTLILPLIILFSNQYPA
jgi:hypothetical protein